MPNKSMHEIIISDSRNLSSYIKHNSINLVVTSPPYPMIEMWDSLFHSLNNNITRELIRAKPNIAFELMHQELDKVYGECIKVLKPDGIICINIGDATRTINGFFQMYTNGNRTVKYFLSNGFTQLPSIIWSKPTNAPNKFMGSGMLPTSPYITLEYEHILIFRKQKREFKSLSEINNRQSSAFFQHERNVWCSNIWTINGVKQKNINKSRNRNGAYPLMIPYRLISLFSVKGDTVLDPFGGTGTTAVASVALNRNSIVVEIANDYKEEILNRIRKSIEPINILNKGRISKAKQVANEKFKYFNKLEGIQVRTSQEQRLVIPIIKNIVDDEKRLVVNYEAN